MTIRSLRLGHATNSSSAHSIIFSRETGLDPYPQAENRSLTTEEQFCEDNFSLTETREKARYILQDHRFDTVSHHQIAELKKIFAKHGLSSIVDERRNHADKLSEAARTMIDSVIAQGVPLSMWIDFLLDPAVSISGYYDNDDTFHNNVEPHVRDRKMVEISEWDMRIKRDGPALVIHDKTDGSRLRWSPEPYDKALTPELVDVKDTDYCPYGCAFCYQGSTRKGRHAPLEDIVKILDQLADMKVFEVAIGGGEPAMHPRFAEIAMAAQERDITFNFTCYGLDWLKNTSILDVLRKNSGFDGPGFGIGVSVHDARDLVKAERLKEHLIKNKIHSQVIAQTVVGATPPEVMDKLLDIAFSKRISMLLLGYKTVGRGVDFRPHNTDDSHLRALLEKSRKKILEASSYTSFTLSVDTAFLDLHGPILDEMEVPHILRASPEGKFSMYVDAVNRTCGPSSYCPADMMEPITQDIRSQFAKW